MRSRGVLALALLLLAGQAMAGGFAFDAEFTVADLEGLTRAMGDVLAFPNLGPASPSGLVGFEVLAAGGGPQVDTDSHWWEHGVDGSTAGGLLVGGRLIARKGLPARLDVGVQYGKVLGEDFWGAEARWALLEGGAVEPALAVRAAYTKLEADVAEFEVTEGQLVLSKGFALLTPYAMAGWRKCEGRGLIGASEPVWESVSNDGFVGAAGVRFGLPPFRLVAEARKGEELGFFVGVGVGL